MNGKNEIRVAELFAGIGGFRLGLEQANNNREFLQKQKTESLHGSTDITRRSSRVNGFRVIWANEWDKYAASIYRKNFGEKELVEGDITKIEADNIPDFDLLCGGFPCQPFSLAGKRQGFKDIRGTMFFEIARIAEAKKPSLLLLENVKGLLSHDNGDTFEAITRTLDELGYDVEWQVLNSKYFGVPQNRERVFIIGHLRGTSFRQIFPIGEIDEEFNGFSKKTQREGERVCPSITARYFKTGKTDPYILQEHSHSGADGKGRGVRVFQGTCPTLASQMGTGGNNVPMVVADRTRSYVGLGRNLESPKPIANTLSCVQKDNLVLLDNFGGNIKQRIKSVDNPAWTLGGSKTGVVLSVFAERKPDSLGRMMPVHRNRAIRRLTEVECERLQGFPDGWTEGVSSTQRYKMLGNAVTVNVIEILGEEIKGGFCN